MSWSITLLFITLSQGLSLNMELSWQPENSSDSLSLPLAALAQPELGSAFFHGDEI